MAWEGKYKSDQYAQFYAGKHDATPLRRVSNRFEIAMVRRSLHRIQRRVAFKTVLDCPSGTGRFLPTLAGFDVSVVAMDTSGSMLEQGRRHRPLFHIAPEVSVGSALDIPLRDQCVDLVLCARLLHHFPDSDARIRILTEFARVARGGVVVTFFDASSYRGWRRMRKKRHSEKKHGRYAITRAQCAHEGAVAGLRLLGMNALLRFHTEITAAAFLTDATAKPTAPNKTQP